ncbi:LysR substrate-binding domain-containing protein [Roseibacterium sp. SDUM158017]|uniref:hydrogen peroxide-inducible genes activator n=1 Tax=Roseicyclus salinarum TaxID=3036773 RepID=UPI0024159132|nr:hydrogen peroxide-inducible genes activator [Roseibacterium sp. SDUM158017]MDG4647762.1 LysR substrate-binding domain-containing protein [Roseibacterium sp. SDUM158017]
MLNVTLKQMRYFDALARQGHFGRAADACAITQPALSMQIRDMERELGTPLFERGSRTVTLTGFGEEVLHRVRDVLRTVNEVEDMARAARDRLAGRIRIGVIPTVAPYLLPRIVGELTARHPGLDLQLRETVTPRLLSELADGNLDTAIVALPVSETAFEEVALFTEAFVLVRPGADADRPVPGPARLREMRLLLLEEGHCFRDQALSFCNMTASAPREMMDGSSLSTLVQMVGAGLGVTLIPEMAVGVETRSADVSIARFDAPGPQRTIGMIWRRSTPLGEQLRDISGIVKDAAARTAGPLPVS